MIEQNVKLAFAQARDAVILAGEVKFPGEFSDVL